MTNKVPDRDRRRLAVEDTVKRLNDESVAHGLTPGYKVGFIGDLAYVALANTDINRAEEWEKYRTAIPGDPDYVKPQTRERLQPKPKRERL